MPLINSDISINTAELKKRLPDLHAGDTILLSGTVFSARDAAHKMLIALIKDDKPLPFKIDGSVIYYCGPTPAKPGMPIGSSGPTTSSRMDIFMDTLLDLGLLATIGKGERSKDVCDTMKKHGAIYLCAMGGAGAISADCIKKCDVIAFEELGCESIKKMEFCNFPLIVGTDIYGNSIFNTKD